MNKLRVIFVTGDRNWMDQKALRDALSGHAPGTWLLHGGCRGADMAAAYAGMAYGFQEIRMDAPWGYYDKKAGPLRNRAMGKLLAALRDAGATVTCYACHDDLKNSKGTKDMIAVLEGHGFAWERIRSASAIV